MAKYIGNIPSVGEFKKLDSLTSTFNGSLTQFNLEYGSTSVSVGDASQLIVSLNGIVQEPLTSYTLAVGGSAIVFSSAPASTDTCHIILLGGVGGTSTVSDGAVTAAKLDAGLKDYLEETYSANGSQTTYTLTRAPIGTNDLMITIDGIVQPSTAYSVAGTTLTISPALPNGTDVRVVHMGVRAGFVVPSSSSITAAMFQDFTTDVKFNDNAKALFGTGDDLQIYHDAGNSYIKETGSGALVLQSAGPAIVLEKTDGENMILANIDGDVKLYYNGSEKIATTSTGIDVTGTVTADGLTVDGATGEFRGSGANTTYFTGGDDSVAGRQLTLSSEANSGQNNAIHRLTVPSGYGSFNVSVNSAERLKINNNGDISFYEDTGTTAKFFWDASTERLGIGTSAPNTTLDITTASNTNGFVLDIIGTAPNYMFDVRDDGASKFRIDSSGKVLVGKTSAGYNVDGFEAHQNGETYVSRSGTPMAINRNSSDGTLLNFYKDGGGVGSIGTNTNGNFQLHGSATSHVGLQFGSPSILPINNSGASSDNAVDLGDSNVRFKDLYLSGGIYLGGTGSTNKLDDYEEGTFTPFMRINNGVEGITYNGRSGSYIKIGNLVTVMIYMHLSSKGTNVGGVSIDGLPFTAGDNLSTTSFNGNCLPTYFANMATNISTLHGWVDDGTTEMYLRHTDGSGNSSTQNTTNGNMNNNTDFRFFITYIAA